MLVEENRLLAPFTTFGIGGPARWFVQAATEDEIAETADWARTRGAPLFVLGGGSNLLIADKGFDGLVLRVALRGIAMESASAENRGILRAAAGEPWEHCVQRAVEADWAGIECLAGIPGTAGGTPVQNVGAYGQEVAQTIERVRAFDVRERTFVELAAAECGFSYRRSRFNSSDRGRFIVTRVDFRLSPGAAPSIRYPELQRARASQDGAEPASAPALAQVAETVRRIRRAKGMLIADGDPDCRSAGSFFKNPIVAREKLPAIAAAASGAEPPHFPAGAGNGDLVKLSAAWLVEQAGFARGYALGGAAISSRHALALVNKGIDAKGRGASGKASSGPGGSDSNSGAMRADSRGRGSATADEILALAEKISSAVESHFGVELEREPVLVGF